MVHLLKSPFSTQTSQGGDSLQNLHVLQWSLWIPLIFLIRESERNCRAPLHGRCWSGLVISFWFLVRSLGAKAYEHVRSIVTLPGKSTLQRHFAGLVQAWKESLLNTNKSHVICHLFRRLHDLDGDTGTELMLCQWNQLLVVSDLTQLEQTLNVVTARVAFIVNIDQSGFAEFADHTIQNRYRLSQLSSQLCAGSGFCSGAEERATLLTGIWADSSALKPLVVVQHHTLERALLVRGYTADKFRLRRHRKAIWTQKCLVSAVRRVSSRKCTGGGAIWDMMGPSFCCWIVLAVTVMRSSSRCVRRRTFFARSCLLRTLWNTGKVDELYSNSRWIA